MWNETTEEEYVVEMSYYRYWQGDTMDDMLQIIKDELRIPTPLVEVEDQFEFGLWQYIEDMFAYKWDGVSNFFDEKRHEDFVL